MLLLLVAIDNKPLMNKVNVFSLLILSRKPSTNSQTILLIIAEPCHSSSNWWPPIAGYSLKNWKILHRWCKRHWRHWLRLANSELGHSGTPSPSISSLPLYSLPSLPSLSSSHFPSLSPGTPPLNQLGGLGSSLVGSGTKPRPTNNFVHIWAKKLK